MRAGTGGPGPARGRRGARAGAARAAARRGAPAARAGNARGDGAAVAAEVEELRALRKGLEKDLAEKGEEWRAARRAAGGVVTGGVDVASQSLDGAEGADEDLVRQVDAGTFHAAVEEAEGLVVVDFYTQNCGPCRLMYPKVVEMANLFKVDGVTFLKMLCSQGNKEIGKAFKVRVAPTFVLLRDGEEVARMTGAHADELLELVKKHL